MNDTERRLRSDVEALATPRGRCVGTPAHEAARAWLVAESRRRRLEPYADGLYEWPYQGGGDALCNVLARVPGTARERPPVLLAAHYDTCGVQPGADDNAAAIAISLELARALLERPASRDLVLAWFDGEEPPHFLGPSMGSIYFDRQQRREPLHAAVVLDLVGHAVPIPERGELLFVTGAESDPALAPLLERVPAPHLRVMPLLNDYVGDMSDHHVFRATQRPYLFLSCGQWIHYHRPSDTPAVLDYPKMAAIARYLEALVRALMDTALSGPFGVDTLAVELAAARRHFGPLARQMGIALDDRAALSRFILTARSAFGLLD